MSTWKQKEVRNWIVKKCWEEHEQNPAGYGLMLAESNLTSKDPSWNEVLQAIEYLMGKYEVTGDYGRAMGSQIPRYVNKLRLAQEAISKLQDNKEKVEDSSEEWEPRYLP